MKVQATEERKVAAQRCEERPWAAIPKAWVKMFVEDNGVPRVAARTAMKRAKRGD